MLLLSNAMAANVVVVEYYNASQDHYFISSLQADITALDTGKFAGWVRTGNVFGAYSTANAGSSPVCRFYIPPALGDSHFYRHHLPNAQPLQAPIPPSSKNRRR